MDKTEGDLVNLPGPQVGQITKTSVHLRSSQEDIRMLLPTIVDRIRELVGQGLGSKDLVQNNFPIS